MYQIGECALVNSPIGAGAIQDAVFQNTLPLKRGYTHHMNTHTNTHMNKHKHT